MYLRLGRLFGLYFALLLAVPTVSAAEAPPAVASVSAPLEEFLARGSDLEQQRLWQQAADVYERALKLYPKTDELRERWRQAERRYSLSRRYHDPSFVGELLNLNEDQAVELYSEVLGKIQAQYVHAVELDQLVRVGYRNLNLALGEALFLEHNLNPAALAETNKLRELLQTGPRRPILSIKDAGEEAKSAGRLCQSHGFRTSAAVIMEFLTAACEELDPYSSHLTPNRLRDLYGMIDGNFVGLGIEVRGDAQGLNIVNVLPDSPAEEGMLTAGDHIVEVDGQQIVGLTAEDAANRLQGKAGVIARLKLKLKDGSFKEVSIPRREVVVHSVTSAEVIDPERGIGYIRLGSFQKLTVRELEHAVNRLSNRNFKGLVLDLRGNPGGLLDVAVQAANHFIDHGVLVSTDGRAWGQSWSHRARPMKTWKFPLVVLVDGDSASASEIFAGAIKDHNRGLVVGTRTFGKGSVQSIFPLRSANSGLRLTTAKFYSPKGAAYEGVGVEPHVVVHRQIGPLGEESPAPSKPLIAEDTQLREACRQLSETILSSQLSSARPARPVSMGTR